MNAVAKITGFDKRAVRPNTKVWKSIPHVSNQWIIGIDIILPKYQENTTLPHPQKKPFLLGCSCKTYDPAVNRSVNTIKKNQIYTQGN